MAERLSLFLPTFACDLLRRRRRLDPRHPILLTRADHQRDVVAHCCPFAQRKGILAGMALADARALLSPDTFIAPCDDDATLHSLRRLAERLLEFVPVVALDPPHGLLLDATGCDLLYGGVARLAPRLQRWLARRGVFARVAAAPTWGAAWALARFGSGPIVAVSAGQMHSALGPLPVRALRVDETTVERLNQVGVERIEQVLTLPRASLADRQGRDLLHRLDQAFGHAMETIVPIVAPEPVVTDREFDGPTNRSEDIQCCARQLVGEASALLARRQHGCRQMSLTLRRSNLPALVLHVCTSRPTCDAKHLWALLRLKMESAPLGFGVDGLRVQALHLARLSHAQITAWNDAPAHVPAEIGALVDTLAARLGPKSVRTLVPVESHIPERALRFEPVGHLEPAHEPWITESDRPSMLLAEPLPIEAMLLLPDGPIASLRIDGAARRILACIGPERIEAEWWHRAGDARDYFKVQTQEGRWWWVYRQRARWFLHGEWA